MNTRLFLENREIELDETVQFAITKQFEDLSNPTTIINDWSKTVSIPFTARNNEIFGHIYNPDKLTVEGSANQALTGIYFNPYKKLDMRLQWGDDVLMVGYAKMNEIKQNNGKGTYEITLFGQLGKVFSEMKKITFDTSSSDTGYIINGEEYVSEEMNRQLVYNSWTSNGQSTSVLKKKTDSGYNVTDIIGFAPNNSFSENFEYKTFQYDSEHSNEFTNTLGESFKESTGIDATTVIPNGLLPREISEYRSYLQLPFIYWNKLFQIFQNKVENVTGYKFDLDSTWFNTTNPYWYKLVYMLKNMSYIKNPTYTNTYSSTQTINFITYHNISQRYNYNFTGQSNSLGFNSASEQKHVISNDGTYFTFANEDIVNGQVGLTVSMKVACNLGESQTLKIRNNAVFVIYVHCTDGTTTHTLGSICVKDVNSSYVAGGSTYTANVGAAIIPSGSYTWTLFSGNYTFNIPSDRYNGNLRFYYTVSGWHAEPSFSGTLFVNSNPSSVDLGNITTSIKPYTMNMNITPLLGKSFSKFTLNTLWNNDFNLFDEILKYCKMYRIIITVDDYNKKILFRQQTTYFNNYTVLDWTDKVDKSKDYNITPITFENKYVLFNYKDIDTHLGKEYNKKYGLNYGEYRLITEYNFNTETKKIFKDITPSIVNTDAVLSWENLFTYKQIIYSFPSEIFVYNKDKDKKQVDIFGAYYFHNGLANFSTESALHLREVDISDDTPFQQRNNTYFYTQLPNGDYRTSVDTYPKLDIINGNNACVFNMPKANYTYLDNYSGKKSIYTNFWEKYINEQYNIQNKKITCYMRIKPTDYINFDFNKLIKVCNQLCLLNKIYDYDVTNNKSTKVELITINNPSGYTTNNF